MYKIVKRIMDVFFAILALIILFPVFVPIVIILLLTGEREVFYFQKRLGYQNKEFDIWKFATMLKNSPNIGTGIITLRNDPRVTKVGKFLRKSKINELPQLINVIIGNMSFVGPRPLVRKSFDQYAPEVKNLVYQSVPGITGIGSLVFRDEEGFASAHSNPIEAYKIVYAYKGKLEAWYHQRKSFIVDFWIIILTGISVISPNSQLVYKIFADLPRDENFSVQKKVAADKATHPIS